MSAEMWVVAVAVIVAGLAGFGAWLTCRLVRTAVKQPSPAKKAGKK